ncbi:7424_t:CDS:2 [Dentiscutata erythropus]|uniref:7424_t:CDS:1 n=1 Tax=Dentiscutata erythropus TaxID=1348616 RepID=A0A9N9B5H4_9GLOM|nr:7424_t:CDS:2 [Dentiscutata erythropus]
MSKKLRSGATRLSPEAISDIITAKGTANALPILPKKYNVSCARIREIWEFTIFAVTRIPTVVRPSRPAFRCLEAVYWAVLKHTCLRPESQYAVFQDAFTIPTVVRPSRPAFRCLEAVYWVVLKHTCLRPESQYAVFQCTMFESVVTEYLEKTEK